MLDSLYLSILRRFACIDDPRQNAKMLYPLGDRKPTALDVGHGFPGRSDAIDADEPSVADSL
jgi:hypothetical protein